jgi:hypothetical protein
MVDGSIQTVGVPDEQGKLRLKATIINVCKQLKYYVDTELIALNLLDARRPTHEHYNQV